MSAGSSSPKDAAALALIAIVALAAVGLWIGH